MELSNPLSGVVRQGDVHAGDEVAKGQLLLSLDDRGFKAQVQKAEAEVIKARGARAEAERELARAKDLYDRTLLSDHELQVAKIAAASAAADFESAKADLTLARLHLEYSHVRAPFHAVVLRRSVEEGQTVVTRMQSVPLLTLAEIGRMLVRIEVGDAQLATLKRGEQVAVRVGARSYTGTVRRIGMEPVTGSGGKYALDSVFSYPSADGLHAGESAVAVLP